MSYLSFRPECPPSAPAPQLKSNAKPGAGGNLRQAFSKYLLAKHGGKYRKTVAKLNAAARAKNAPRLLAGPVAGTGATPLVGIVGGGFSGMFAGIILQSLGLEFEIFEASDRVGGRIKTWYSTDYDPKDENRACLYGEVGGMRLPQFAPDMLLVQQLALAVNAVLARNGRHDAMVYWRKFYYNSPVQRMRFNNMAEPIIARNAGLDPLNFDEKNGGDVPKVWTKVVKAGDQSYLPINQVMGMVNQPFITALNQNFNAGFEQLMKFDQYSMWGYLTNVFQLKQLGKYYDPAMGDKTDHLPWSVANYLETTNVGSGMFMVSFVEMVLAAYDWSYSKDPYRPNDPNVYMLTVNQGMQHFPDACRAVLDLDDGVTVEDGVTAQMQLGVIPNQSGKKQYDPPNLTPDARPLPPEGDSGAAATRENAVASAPSAAKPRLHLQHRAIEIKFDPKLFKGAGGVKLKLEAMDASGKGGSVSEKTYPYVIATLPFGAYLNGDKGCNLLNDISFEKAQALRECNYMPSFKAFLTFKKNFWAELGERQGYDKSKGLGAASTDRPNRQIIYPSYGYGAEGGVLQVYSWAEDARRMGALSDEGRVNECLKGIAYLYPDADVFGAFAGYDPERTTKTWFWDSHAGGGAFALFNPSQFKQLYPTLRTPDLDGHLLLAGEACSVHHGWIVGALDAAYNAVHQILSHLGLDDKIEQMEKTWGAGS